MGELFLDFLVGPKTGPTIYPPPYPPPLPEGPGCVAGGRGDGCRWIVDVDG